jgi:hypothetical protein
VFEPAGGGVAGGGGRGGGLVGEDGRGRAGHEGSIPGSVGGWAWGDVMGV